MSARIYKAIILNEPFAGKVKDRIKLIETRMRAFKHRGDLVICCDKGKSKDSPNAGKALCIVDVYDVRPMIDEDVIAACIENTPGRYSYLLRDWRYFSYDFNVSDYAVTKNWQGLFDLRIPDFIEIIPTAL